MNYKNIKKSEIYGTSMLATSVLFIIISIFTRFANGFNLKVENVSYKFEDSFFKFHFGENGEGANGWLILSFCLMVIALLALITSSILYVCKKTNKGLHLGIVIPAAVMLFVSSLMALLSKQIIFANELGSEEVYQYIHLGAGPIVSGVFGMLAACFAGCGIAIYSKK